MPRLFGTDGVRGVANRELTPDLALALGRAAGRVLAPEGGDFVVGRDTRVSGPMLEGALVAGLCSAGANVCLAGIIPSPGVAWLATHCGARAGAVISASHNPVDDNGIKFFSDRGMKLAAELEDDIEARLVHPEREELPRGASVGSARPLAEAHDRYVDHLLATIDGLEGLKVVLDCAYGAAWELAPRAFRRAGAEVIALHAEPDGTRINVDCGSTAMDVVAGAVVAEGADIGFGFDGDADRVLAVDERGEIVDGDGILALLALALHGNGALFGGVIVTTVMSNLGFRRALEERGIEIITAPVGDRFVVEAMFERGAILGGEQSGHIIFGRHAATGDGILAALQVAQCAASDGATLRELKGLYSPWPQVLVNVRVGARDELEQNEELWSEVADAERSLGDEGRVLLRASGTEPVVRVMVEAADERRAQAVADRLAESVRRHLGA